MSVSLRPSNEVGGRGGRREVQTWWEMSACHAHGTTYRAAPPNHRPPPYAALAVTCTPASEVGRVGKELQHGALDGAGGEEGEEAHGPAGRGGQAGRGRGGGGASWAGASEGGRRSRQVIVQVPLSSASSNHPSLSGYRKKAPDTRPTPNPTDPRIHASTHPTHAPTPCIHPTHQVPCSEGSTTHW